MEYRQIILNRLLDKYEKSKSYYKDTNRRIILNVQNIKEYNIEDYDKKMLFHDILKDLKIKGLVDFCYLKYEEGNILDKIWLEKDNIDRAYLEINRENPKSNYIIIIKELENIEFINKWLREFSIDVIEYMNKNQRENKLLPFEKLSDILKALKEIDNMQNNKKANSILKRIFSKKCYNDSKFFERYIEKYILKIVRQYYLKDNDVLILSDDDILREVGIEKYPEIIEFCGNLVCRIKEKAINFSDVTKGSYLNTNTILNISQIELIGIDKIIWIENKANYVDYIQSKRENEFVIYHGGFYSPVKGEFFRKIYNASINNSNEIKYFHWSDIDVGGFEIFVRLKENIVKQLEPLNMSKEILLENKECWNIFDEKYKNKLLTLRENKNYSMFYDVIDVMSKYNCKLEQEALIM